MLEAPKHTQTRSYTSEVVTLALLFALTGVGERAFYRWVVRDWLLLPQLPDRTWLFRLFQNHQAWTDRFLAAPLCWAWPTAMGLNCSSLGARAAARSRSAKRGFPTMPCWPATEGVG